jgi:predicted metal-dependent phosphoesterase TrpH
MMRFDMHLHTDRHSGCSVMKPLELVERALAAGLDGVVITDHDYLWPDEELRELRDHAPGLVILSGIEVTGRGGDVLVYGVTDPFALPKGIDWPDLCREVHRQGGACVMAHPYRWGQPVDQLMRDKRPEFDGLELMSSNMDDELRSKAAALHARHPHLAGLGNSDGHHPDKVGCCYTEFDAVIRTPQDIVRAIRERKTRAVVRAGC